MRKAWYGLIAMLICLALVGCNPYALIDPTPTEGVWECEDPKAYMDFEYGEGDPDWESDGGNAAGTIYYHGEEVDFYFTYKRHDFYFVINNVKEGQDRERIILYEGTFTVKKDRLIFRDTKEGIVMEFKRVS